VDQSQSIMGPGGPTWGCPRH